MHAPFPDLLTRAEVAALARVDVGRVEQWDRRRLIPRVRPRGTKVILYPRDAVLAWLHGETSPTEGKVPR
jgi:hypothetical protein